MNTKHHKADLNVIAGALEGINNYLYNFTQSTEEKSVHSVTIFEYMKRALLSSPEDLTRYAMPKGFLFKYKFSWMYFKFWIFFIFSLLIIKLHLNCWANMRNNLTNIFSITTKTCSIEFYNGRNIKITTWKKSPTWHSTLTINKFEFFFLFLQWN